MYKVCMVSLGCPKNQVDAEMMLKLLENDGFEICGEEAQADAIIINTCGFIESAKAEAIENILEASQYKKDGNCKALVVTGCLAERYRDDVTEEIPEVDVCVGIGSNDKIAEIVKNAIEGKKGNFYGEKNELNLNNDRILGGYPFSTYLKIGDGCDNCCTYCAIPKIRGRMRSRTIEDCVNEAKKLADKGVTELIVVAQDTTAYGEDIYGESKLPELLTELCKIEGLHWIRTLYTYPDRITDKLLDTIAREQKLVKYLDIPLQHVNGEILKRMNRKGDCESLSDLIDKIRVKIPDITLRTTLITGFPGETEEQFCEMAEFVKEKRFDRLGCFTYSAEEGTLAAEFPDQIDEQVKADRMENIMELQMTISAEKNEEKAGTVTEVLIEGWDDYIKCYFGRTAADAPEVDGKIFFMSSRPLKIGEYVNVRINDCLDYDLLGELEE
ncbi:MAG: 30S ribosomal protein S12 methylthiotransferase RimO [Clostridia bacterium]|nr:30S ribosomal protein S12 methylthiotransferase RimO [Clostridia bacterium]MEE1054669.1 30S ribosomal protein S12 methylthiotransferase RimO [Acutalibacteraceae bacterium]